MPVAHAHLRSRSLEVLGGGRDHRRVVGPTEPTDPDATITDADPDAGSAPVEPGAPIGRYVVLSKLGAGAMGQVLAAYDPELDRQVALKLLRPAFSGDETRARARLQREARALARLNHPNVVSVHDVGVHGEQVFVAMEMVRGQTLGAWMRERGGKVDWRRVIDVFSAAGRGLAAAHAADLVHRDFKPENVMLDERERPRVMDFGLAQLGDRPAFDPTAEDGAADGDGGVRLTRAGSVVGTPAYMAPEQFAGLEVGPHSDQFSFCVCLYEALYGERPFAGASFAELALSVTDGEIRPVPAGTKIPGWLRAVVIRGLTLEPQGRYPSMEALLFELDAARTRRRRRLVALGVTIALLAVGGGFAGRAWMGERALAQCRSDAAASVAEVWAPRHEADLRAAVAATELPFGPASLATSIPMLDAYAGGLVARRDEVCRADLTRRWSPAIVERANVCLDRRTLDLRTLVDTLTDEANESTATMHQSAGALPVLDACVDQWLLERQPTGRRGPVERNLEAQLALARAQMRGGRLAEAVATSRAALEASDELETGELPVEIRRAHGDALVEAGEYAEARRVLEQSYFDAASIGASHEAADAAIRLVLVAGAHLDDYRAADDWARHAESLLTREPPLADVRRRAALINAKGASSYAAGEYVAALKQLRSGLELETAALGPDHPALAELLNNVGHAALAGGQRDAARAEFERALALRRDTLGERHPTVASALSNLANTYEEPELWDDAVVLYEQTIEILEAQTGPPSVVLASTLNNLAITQSLLGHPERALEAQERSVEIQRAIDAEGSRMAALLSSLGSLYTQLGRTEEAYAVQLEAVQLAERTLGSEHVRLGLYLTGLASIEYLMERTSTGIRHAERAVAIFDASDTGPAPPARARVILGRLLRHRDGKLGSRAREVLQEAAAAYATDPEVHADDLADVEALLAGP
jgi:tetratricopeptide (TPR) repeat protein